MPVTVSEAAWYAVTDGSANMCFYLMDTGNQRDCEPGDGCLYYTTEKCKEKPMIWDEIKED